MCQALEGIEIEDIINEQVHALPAPPPRTHGGRRLKLKSAAPMSVRALSFVVAAREPSTSVAVCARAAAAAAPPMAPGALPRAHD